MESPCAQTKEAGGLQVPLHASFVVDDLNVEVGNGVGRVSSGPAVIIPQTEHDEDRRAGI